MWVFVHIPKTGGISISNAVARGVAGTVRLHVQQQFDEFAQMSARAVADIPVLCGHVPMGLEWWIRSASNGQRIEAPRYVTIIRDPLERLLSWYWFRVHHSQHEPFAETHQRTFSEWALSNDYETDNILTRFFLPYGYPLKSVHWPGSFPVGKLNSTLFEYAWSQISRLDFVGFYEHFNRDARRILELVGAKEEIIQRENVTPSRMAVTDISPSIADAIRERNKWDYALIAKVKKAQSNEWRPAPPEIRGFPVRDHHVID